MLNVQCWRVRTTWLGAGPRTTISSTSSTLSLVAAGRPLARDRDIVVVFTLAGRGFAFACNARVAGHCRARSAGAAARLRNTKLLDKYLVITKVQTRSVPPYISTTTLRQVFLVRTFCGETTHLPARAVVRIVSGVVRAFQRYLARPPTRRRWRTASSNVLSEAPPSEPSSHRGHA